MPNETVKKFEEMTNKVKYSDYLMPWGKYRGEFLADIYVEDPEYFHWALENVVDKELKKALEFQITGE